MAASPVVTGIAAVLRGYFPELTAAEIKEIIVKSASKYDCQVKCPGKEEKESLVPFSKLCVSGGIANLYNAVLLAEEYMKAKKK